MICDDRFYDGLNRPCIILLAAVDVVAKQSYVERTFSCVLGALFKKEWMCQLGYLFTIGTPLDRNVVYFLIKLIPCDYFHSLILVAVVSLK